MSQEELRAPEIILPSRLRIMQRLGQVSTDSALRDNLYPAIASFERESMTPEILVDMLSEQTDIYAERHILGISVVVMQKIPAFINALVDDEEAKDKSLVYWRKNVADKIAKDESAELVQRYRRGNNMPRKMKKRNKRNSNHR